MVLAAVAGDRRAMPALLGRPLQALSAFLALGVAFVSAPVIAYATKGRFYIARTPRQNWAGQLTIRCVICEHPFETEDMAHCPAYSGPICSLCCSLETRCRDCCKPQARASNQIADWVGRRLPDWIIKPLDDQHQSRPLSRRAVAVLGADRRRAGAGLFPDHGSTRDSTRLG